MRKGKNIFFDHITNDEQEVNTPEIDRNIDRQWQHCSKRKYVYFFFFAFVVRYNMCTAAITLTTEHKEAVQREQRL